MWGVAFLQVLAHVNSVEDQDELRARVLAAGLVGFVIDGAVLPRRAGNSDLVRHSGGGVDVAMAGVMTRSRPWLRPLLLSPSLS